MIATAGLFAVGDIVVYAVVAASWRPGATALLPWARAAARFAVCGLTTTAAFIAWNLTLNATHAAGFNTDAPSWRSAGPTPEAACSPSSSPHSCLPPGGAGSRRVRWWARPPSPGWQPSSSTSSCCERGPMSEAVEPEENHEVGGHPEPQPLRAFLRYFLGLGTWGFGGPIASVGYMQRDLVERREWLDRDEFLDGVALGQTMPGPLAAQVSMWVGYLRAGVLGALAVAGAFILPSFVLVLTVAVLYVHYQGLSVVQSLFYGIAPAVMAIIAIAAYKLARLTDGTDRRLWVLTVVIGVITAVTGAEIALLFVGAGLLMIVLDAPPTFLQRGHAALWPASPVLGALGGLTASAGTHIALALFFLKAGAFIFGSGLAIVPFLREGVVHQHHWLTERQFLDAVAMGLITQGPVVITATFIGYLVGGLTGAIVATLAIFIPIYLGVVVPGRWFIRHRDHAQVKAFVKGATAAAAGAIAGATVVLTRQAVVDVPTGVIAVVALAVLWRFKVREPYIVLAGAIAGLLLH
jgi:chromate transporter